MAELTKEEMIAEIRKRRMIDEIRARKSDDPLKRPGGLGLDDEKDAISMAQDATAESGGTDPIVEQALFGRDDVVSPEGKDFLSTMRSIATGLGGAIPRIADKALKGDLLPFDGFVPNLGSFYKGAQNLGKSFDTNVEASKQFLLSPLETLGSMGKAAKDPEMVEEMAVGAVDLKSRVEEDPVGIIQDLIPAGRAISTSNKFLKHIIDSAALGRGSVPVKLMEGVKEGIDRVSKNVSQNIFLGEGKRSSVVLDEVEKIVGKEAGLVDVIRDVHRDGVDFDALEGNVKQGLIKYDTDTKDEFFSQLQQLPDVPIDRASVRQKISDVLRNDFKIKIIQRPNGDFRLDFDTPINTGDTAPFAIGSPSRKMVTTATKDIANLLRQSDSAKTLYAIKRRLNDLFDDPKFLEAKTGDALLGDIEEVVNNELKRVLGAPFDEMNEAYTASRAAIKKQKKQLPIDSDGDIDTGALEVMMEDSFLDSQASANKLASLQFVQDISGVPIVPMAVGLATKNTMGTGFASKALQIGAFLSSGIGSIALPFGMGFAVPVGIAVGRLGSPRGMANLSIRRSLNPQSPLMPNLFANLTNVATVGQATENKRQRAEKTLLDKIPPNIQR